MSFPTSKSSPPRSVRDKTHLFEMYKLYRDYVVHEDALIDHRLQRWLTMQAFLFAAVGTILVKLIELLSAWTAQIPVIVVSFHASVVRMILASLLLGFISLTCWIGRSTTGIVHEALLETGSAHSRLEEWWKKTGFESVGMKKGLPGIHAASNPNEKGKADHSRKLPELFLPFWTVLFWLSLLSALSTLVIAAGSECGHELALVFQNLCIGFGPLIKP